jgi:hypothetical protein
MVAVRRLYERLDSLQALFAEAITARNSGVPGEAPAAPSQQICVRGSVPT